MTEPWQLAATEALAAMRARELSPVELLDSVIARAETVEPAVNAFTEIRYEGAVEEARAAEQRYAKGERIRRLEGLPIALKEGVEVRGWRMRHGSLAVDEVAGTTAPVAERIFRAGAIVHARTATPEFSCAGYTHSKLWGVTRNPWNPELSAGGSSGGSGASLASGTSLLASGSDIGGSIRLPAAANGIVGYKPPHGRVPVGSPLNLDRFCHEGPMARTVTDCAVFQNAIVGPHPRDVTTLRPRLRIPPAPKGIEAWRIAVSVDLGGWTVHPEVIANTRGVADALRAAGAVVEEVEIPWSLEEIATTARRHFAAIFGEDIQAAAAEHRDLLCDYTLAWAEEATAFGREPGSFLRGLEGEQRIWEPLGQLFRRYRALVCPTWAVPGIPAGDSILGTLYPGGGPNDRQYAVMMTSPFNILAPCPVLAVPSGFAANGGPTGVQIVGRTYDDVGVFRVGAAVERARPWPTTIAP